jgi:hypothetical protein
MVPSATLALWIVFDEEKGGQRASSPVAEVYEGKLCRYLRTELSNNKSCFQFFVSDANILNS